MWTEQAWSVMDLYMAKKELGELCLVPVGTNAGNRTRALRSAHPGSNSEHRVQLSEANESEKRAWILEARAQLFEGRRISLTHGCILIPIPNSSVQNTFLFILIHCLRSSKHQILGKKNQQESALQASKVGVKFLTNPGLSCFKQPAQV